MTTTNPSPPLADRASAARTVSEDPQGRTCGGRALEVVAADLAHQASSDELADHAWTHWSFLLVSIHLVDNFGPRAAIDELRAITGRAGLPCLGGTPSGAHETLTVFYVWAVHRLRSAGLGWDRILWHPLLTTTAPLAWYHVDDLRTVEAAQRFIPSTRAIAGEPAPEVPSR